MNGIAALVLTAAMIAVAPPPIVLEARYPGASAHLVESSVAVAFEMSLRGIAGVRRVSTLSTPGRCRVRLELDAKADRPKVRKLASEWLAAGAAQLPQAVIAGGLLLLPDVDDSFQVIAVRPTGTMDLRRLSVFARDRLRLRLRLVPFVAEVAVVGVADLRLRIAIDPTRLAAFDLAPRDVLAALRKATANAPGAAGRAPAVGDLGDTIVAARNGSTIRLSDIALVEQAADRHSAAGILLRDGQAGGKFAEFAAVLLVVQPMPGKARQVQQGLADLLSELTPTLPAEVRLEGPTQPACQLSVRLTTPAGTSLEQRTQLARRASEAIMRVSAEQAVYWNTHAADSDVSMVLSMPAAERRAERWDKVRVELIKLPGVAARFERVCARWPQSPWPGEGMQFVARILGDDLDQLRATAAALRDRMGRIEGVVDLAGDLVEIVPRIEVEFDRDKAAKMGVNTDDARDAFQLATDGLDLPGGGELSGIRVMMPTVGGRQQPDFNGLFVRNSNQQRVPLRTVVHVREVAAAVALYREAGHRCIVVSCNSEKRAPANVLADLRTIAKELSPKGIIIELDAEDTAHR